MRVVVINFVVRWLVFVKQMMELVAVGVFMMWGRRRLGLMVFTLFGIAMGFVAVPVILVVNIEFVVGLMDCVVVLMVVILQQLH